MRRGVLDTDTLSYVLNGRDPRITAYSRQYLRVFRRYTVAVVTVSEIVEGFVRSNDSLRLNDFLTLVEDYYVLPVETEEAVLAGRILGALTRSGGKIGELDPVHRGGGDHVRPAAGDEQRAALRADRRSRLSARAGNWRRIDT